MAKHLPLIIPECVALYKAGDKLAAFEGVTKMKLKLMTPTQKRVLGLAADLLAEKNLSMYAAMKVNKEEALRQADIVFEEFFMSREK